MNILVLTKAKNSFIDENVKNVDDYLEKDYFFQGYVDGFRELGYNVYCNWEESFFLPTKLKVLDKSLYNSIMAKFKKENIDETDITLFSRQIAEFCKEKKIDFIFTELNDFINPDIIRSFYPDVIITQWFGVYPDMLSKRKLEMSNKYDCLWAPGLLNKNIFKWEGLEKIQYIGPSINPKKFYYEYDEQFSYDIVFVGGVGKVHSNRIELLEAIAQKYDNFVFYGYGDKFIPDGYILKQKYKGWADVNTIRKLYSSSKVALNLTLDDMDKNVIKGFNTRLVEIPACGGAVQIVKKDEKIDEFFQDNIDLLTFKTQEELFEKIDYILNNPDIKRQISLNANKKSSKFLYKNRAKKICNVIYTTPRKKTEKK